MCWWQSTSLPSRSSTSLSSRSRQTEQWISSLTSYIGLVSLTQSSRIWVLNFTSQSFWDFCDNSCNEVKYASVAHPRANGQVECINSLILDGLKKRIYDANSKKGGKWIHELPHVIWGLRTQPSKPTGQSPFFSLLTDQKPYCLQT